MKFIRKIPKIWLAAGAGFLIGILIVLAIRFITYDASHTHYHANFAVYINGQREEFKGPSYYEEVTACKQGDEMRPADRAHMHDNVNDVAHVHDRAVTWSQFFENLGWSIGKDFIVTPDKTYLNNAENRLQILINDQNLTGISSITNREIKNMDKLLLSYGSESYEELEKLYQNIPETAHEYNEQDDPAACAGASGTSLSERLKNLF